MRSLILCCLLVLGNLASARDTPVLVSHRGWDETTDYAALRFAFASDPGYNAYLGQAVEKALIAEAMQEWKSGSKADALKKLEEAAETCPFSIETYRRLADGYAVFVEATKDPEKQKTLQDIERHYRVVAEGLLKSIVASGDGVTVRTAFKVISIPEEYMTLWYLGFVAVGQTVESWAGRDFDVLTVRHRKTDAESKVYFDISAFSEKANQPPQRNAGSRPSSDDSSVSESSSSLGPRG